MNARLNFNSQNKPIDVSQLQQRSPEEEALARKVYEELMQGNPRPAPQPTLSSVINKFTQQGLGEGVKELGTLAMTPGGKQFIGAAQALSNPDSPEIGALLYGIGQQEQQARNQQLAALPAARAEKTRASLDFLKQLDANRKDARDFAGQVQKDAKAEDVAKQKEKERVREFVQQNKRLISNIDELLDDPELHKGTGKNALLSGIPGKAKDISAKVKTLIANQAFNTLMEIKRSGASLGGVSGPELELLESQIANLDTLQSDEQFREQLGKVRAELRRLGALAAEGSGIKWDVGEYVPKKRKKPNVLKNFFTSGVTDINSTQKSNSLGKGFVYEGTDE